jgi:hypothetical protein
MKPCCTEMKPMNSHEEAQVYFPKHLQAHPNLPM